jgi:hypothetical protein
MGYLGYKPADKPLTAADITDSIITSAKITDATIVNGDIANATIALAKLSATGTPSASTFLRGDNSWGSAGAAAGQVIQVLSATDSTERSTSSSSFVTASNTLSVSITPSSASNKILILMTGVVYNGGGGDFNVTIFKAGSNLVSQFMTQFKASSDNRGALAISYLDSPNTTSSTTYDVRFLNTSSATSNFNPNGSTSSLICLEVKG